MLQATLCDVAWNAGGLSRLGRSWLKFCFLDQAKGLGT